MPMAQNEYPKLLPAEQNGEGAWWEAPAPEPLERTRLRLFKV
jgi:hypothetical protein